MNQRIGGVVISYIQMICTAFVNLLYVPLLIQTIGGSEYGLYQIIGSVMAYINILESFLTGSVAKFYCKAHIEGNEIKKENTLAIARRMYISFSIIVIITGTIAFFLMKLAYRNSFTKYELCEAGYMLIVMIFNIVFKMQCYVYSVAITANEKFIEGGLFWTIQILLQPIAVILIISKIPNALAVVVAQFLITIIINIARVVYCKRKLKIRIKYHYKDTTLTKNMLLLSSQLLLSLIADMIFWKSDQLILGFWGTAATAIYAVGAQIYMNYTPFGTAVSNVYLPSITKMYKYKNDMKEISDLFIRVGRISMIVSGLVLSGFILFGIEFISLWAGKGYKEAYFIALLIMIPITIENIQHIGLTILQVADKYTFRSIVYFISAFINIILTIYLVNVMGIVGAALATGITIVVCHGFIMNLYYWKNIGIQISKFWLELGKLILAILFSAILGIFIKKINFHIGIIQLIIHILLYCLVYSTIMWLFAMNKYEKNLITNYFTKLKKLKNKKNK